MKQPQQALHTRSYFYVGGEYTSTPHGHVFQSQMYVEKLSPVDGAKKPFPIVFIHGGAQTGTNWLNKPDGGRGWASWFLEKSYDVYIVDQPHSGRSAWYPKSAFPQWVFPAETISDRFTDVRNNSLWPSSRLHTQWPGSGRMGDPVFDAYYASTVQALRNTQEQERRHMLPEIFEQVANVTPIALRDSGTALLDKIGPSILIAHSQGSLGGWSIADSRPNLVKALIQVEPKGPPFREAIFASNIARPWGLTSIPLTYSPSPPNDSSNPLEMEVHKSSSSDRSDCVLQAEPARQLINLKVVPILIVTGEASYHAMYDHCFIEFLTQAGCTEVDHLRLEEASIHGNAHLMFLEMNSDEIAEALQKWISKTINK